MRAGEVEGRGEMFWGMSADLWQLAWGRRGKGGKGEKGKRGKGSLRRAGLRLTGYITYAERRSGRHGRKDW